jgi:hypothetical protein
MRNFYINMKTPTHYDWFPRSSVGTHKKLISLMAAIVTDLAAKQAGADADFRKRLAVVGQGPSSVGEAGGS